MEAQNAGQAADNLDKKHICFSIVGFNKKRIDAVEVGGDKGLDDGFQNVRWLMRSTELYSTYVPILVAIFFFFWPNLFV